MSEQATKGYVRQVAVVGMALVALLIGGMTVKTQVDSIANLRSGCERQNVRTQLQYEKYLADEQESRLFSRQQPPGPVKRITREAANKYADSARALVELVREDGIQLKPDSPQSDCERAYPDPFPFD